MTARTWVAIYVSLCALFAVVLYVVFISGITGVTLTPFEGISAMATSMLGFIAGRVSKSWELSRDAQRLQVHVHRHFDGTVTVCQCPESERM